MEEAVIAGWRDLLRGSKSTLLIWPFRVIKTRMEMRGSSFLEELGDILGRERAWENAGQIDKGGVLSTLSQTLLTFQRGWRGVIPGVVHDIVFNFCRNQLYTLLCSLILKVMRRQSRLRRRHEKEPDDEGDKSEERDEEQLKWMTSSMAADWYRSVMQVSDVVLQQVWILSPFLTKKINYSAD